MKFTRKDLIANTFLNDESIDKILKNQEFVDYAMKLLECADESLLIQTLNRLREDKE